MCMFVQVHVRAHVHMHLIYKPWVKADNARLPSYILRER